MGVPNVVYKWKSLRTLYISVFVMNVAGFVIVIILIVSAIKLRMGVGQYLDLVVPGDANFWPGMMFLIAFLCAPIYAIGIKLCFHLRFLSHDSIPRLNQVLFIHCALCLASMIIMIGINVVGILHLGNFQRINQNGIIESMQEYATELVAKVRIDLIQINFKCCGSKSFKDWFHVRWVQREAEVPDNKERNESLTSFLSTDVPFSCCSTEMLQPCIHHDILKPSEVYLYQPEHRLTIATTGCHAKVLSHARYIGGIFIFFFILLAAYQMVLALLSRLLQTAHSNALYIGPKKDRYLAWILGTMPNTDNYRRLAYQGREVSDFQEMVPRREEALLDSGYFRMEDNEFEGECRTSDMNEEKESVGERCSNLYDSDRISSSTMSRRGVQKKSLNSVKVGKKSTSSSSKSNFIPTPPPSPGTEDKSINERGARSRSQDMELRQDQGLEESMGQGNRNSVTISNNKRKSFSGGTVPKVSGNQLKELRESLECLKIHQSSWRGGSPQFKPEKSLVNVCLGKGENSFESLLEGCRSSSGSSSGYKRYKICGKDSIEEKEIRMKKFCKDLSAEYKKSPYSKQRRDFSEQCKIQDPIHQPGIRDTDNERLIRSAVCARFNPADTYSRFRGSVQDTMMRRASQTLPGPPPIPIPNQRNVNLHPHCKLHQDYPENSQFASRPLQYNQLSKPQGQIGGLFWSPQQKPSWAPRCLPVPMYFPISSRPPRPPRLPECPHWASHQSYQPIQDQSRGARPSQFMKDSESFGPHSQRCQRRCLGGMEPPRFSGC